MTNSCKTFLVDYVIMCLHQKTIEFNNRVDSWDFIFGSDNLDKQKKRDEKWAAAVRYKNVLGYTLSAEVDYNVAQSKREKAEENISRHVTTYCSTDDSPLADPSCVFVGPKPKDSNTAKSTKMCFYTTGPLGLFRLPCQYWDGNNCCCTNPQCESYDANMEYQGALKDENAKRDVYLECKTAERKALLDLFWVMANRQQRWNDFCEKRKVVKQERGTLKQREQDLRDARAKITKTVNFNPWLTFLGFDKAKINRIVRHFVDGNLQDNEKKLWENVDQTKKCFVDFRRKLDDELFSIEWVCSCNWHDCCICDKTGCSCYKERKIYEEAREKVNAYHTHRWNLVKAALKLVFCKDKQI